jgi:GT2 family glycosyltransferase
MHEINQHPDVDLIYSDEDKMREDGVRYDHYFKPDWNPSLILSQNLFSHLGVYRRNLVNQVGGFRLGFEGSQDHDLVLRCVELTTPSRIRHIPRILYHWRAIETSTAAGGGAKPYAWDAGRRAIEEHLAQKNIHAKVEHASRADYYYQVEYTVPTPPPRVSILIPTTAKPELIKPCLDSVLERTTYDDFEVLLLVGETQRAMPDRAAYLSWASQQPRVRVFVYPDRSFNFSWVNNWGTGQATGDILCLLNDDTEIITPDWLEKLVARVSLDGVGAVGSMMYYPDDTIQHAGVVLGLKGIAGHVFRGAPRGSTGYAGRACLEQDLSCVTAGCMAVRKEAYLGIGGMDESFAVAFNDVDFCIRLRAAGWRIIWTPVVELYHCESVSVGRHNAPERGQTFSTEVGMMRELWGPVLDFDPNYNVNLSLSEPFSLAFPPRQTLPRGDGSS